MASTLKANDFELLPMLKQLFKSEHFFRPSYSNVLIKSPIDLMVGMHHSLGFRYDDDLDLQLSLRNKCRDMGQTIFSPVDVAGWQGNHEWINSETLPKRWEFADYLLIRYWRYNKDQFKNLIKSLVDNDETNVEVIVNKLRDFMFCPYEIKQEELADAVNVFIGEVPENYFEDGTWTIDDNTVPRQVYNLMRFFVGLPEFQLK
jgi:hypothetical protein